MTSVVKITDNNGHCLEDVRLGTFDDEWPHKSGNLQPEFMAKAGFYYTKKDDVVSCFCCFAKIAGWEKDDEPKARHIELSPNCLFAQLAKEEGDLTVAEYCDIMCARSIAMLDYKFKRLAKLQERIVAQQNLTTANGETINHQETRSII